MTINIKLISVLYLILGVLKNKIFFNPIAIAALTNRN